MLRELAVLIISFSIISEAMGQNIKISGIVSSTNGETIKDANIIGIEPSTGKAIGLSITNKDGKFSLVKEDCKADSIKLEVSHIGYEKYYGEVANNSSLKIILIESSTKLSEVIVNAKTPSLTQKPGKFIYTPRQVEVEGIDGYRLMHFVPLVIIEGSAVSIIGKGNSTIYINGRKPIMDNDAIMDMLRSIPAEQIKNVEIIPTPGSSFKGSTVGGIVNIILKRNSNQGLRGTVSVTGIYHGERFSPITSLYLNYSNKKFNVNANFFLNNSHALNESSTCYNYNNNSMIVNARNKLSNISTIMTGNLSAAYNLSSNSIVGVALHINNSKTKSLCSTENEQSNSDGISKISSSFYRSKSPYTQPSIGIVTFYNLKTDSIGSNLDLSMNYSHSLGRTNTDMLYSLNESVPFSQFQQNMRYKSNGYEFVSKYTHYFNEDNTLEGGYEFDASNISDNFIRKDYNGEQYVVNSNYSNDFDYQENVNAFFLTFEHTWNDLLSSTVGIRGEHTHVKGKVSPSGEKFSHNYWNWFPELCVLLNFPNDKHSLSIDYSRSIIRPYYNDLNPFKVWTSEYTYSIGNTHLRPLTTTEIDLRYTLLNSYIFGINYCHESDSFTDYSFSDEDNKTVNSTSNFGSENDLTFYININKLFLKGKWHMMANAETEYEHVSGNINDNDAGYNHWSADFSFRNIFILSKARSIDLSAVYEYYTPTKGIFKKGHDKHLLSFSLTKNFKFGGSISIDALNLLNYKPSYHYNSEHYSYRQNPQTNNTTIQMRFAFQFGNKRVRGTKDRSGTKFFERLKK